MKRTTLALGTVFAIFVTLFVLSAVRPVQRVGAHPGCTDASLKGTYGLVASGWFYVASTPFPANFSALVNFDGSGSFTGSELNVITYRPTPTPAGLQPLPGNPYTIAGTYSVNSDCSFTFTIANDPVNPWDSVIGAYGAAVDTGGDEISGNMYSSAKNSTATFDAKRVAVGTWSFLK